MSGQAQASERIGLLLVHGIGEQKRFEHLTSTVTQFAELLRQSEDHCKVSVVDRTRGWKGEPGHPAVDGDAPMTLSFASDKRSIDFECHEVWWADLGATSGILDVVTFWIWGLGQWNAPIYQEMDASGMDAEKKQDQPVRPPSQAGHFFKELRARIRLLWAKLAAVFTLFSWTLAKRIFGKLLSAAPSPTLIEQYVGDVRLYAERASPGKSNPGDPGMPLRVAIRRRMNAQMVAMAARCAEGEYDGWYVVAHSLGTVVAYNALTEIGHTLPNYLPQALWHKMGRRFSDLDMAHKTPRRENTLAMMPARPSWLGHDDAINRQKLFASLRGVLTYGSPLSKFAALWPRIVATARESAQTNPFGANHPGGAVPWVNLVAPTDPVGGKLEVFGSWVVDGAEKNADMANALPVLETHVTPCEIVRPGAAHIRYFIAGERDGIGQTAVQQRLWVMRWLLGEREAVFPAEAKPLPKWASTMSYLAVTVILVATASLLFALFYEGLKALLVAGAQFHRPSVAQVLAVVSGALLLGTALIALAGLWRWARESQLNCRLACSDGSMNGEKRVIAEQLLARQAKAAWFNLAIGLAVILPVLAERFGPFFLRKLLVKWSGLPVWLHDILALVPVVAVILLAAVTQVLINRRWRIGDESGKWAQLAAELDAK